MSKHIKKIKRDIFLIKYRKLPLLEYEKETDSDIFYYPECNYIYWIKLEKDNPQKLITEFINADKIVFVNPMWNHFFPPVMKQYIDVLCVAGKTFRYTADGTVGLLGDKKVLHIQSAGGIYNHNSGEVVDFGSEYLAHMMSFFGIEDFTNNEQKNH